MTYDEAIKQVENIVRELEESEAISVSEYRKRAEEAKKLLDLCEAELRNMDRDLHVNNA